MSDSANTEASGNSPVERKERRSPWVSTWAALMYINGIPKGRVRTSDKTTAIFLGLSIILVGSVMFVPAAFSASAGILTDFILGMTIVSFFINRFGIITTLQERQAVLIWDLMLSMFLAGLYFSINLYIIVMIMRGF